MGRFPVFTASKRRVALGLLRGALEHVKKYRRCAICGAIRAQESTIAKAEVRPLLTDWVFDALGVHAYLEDWLESQAIKKRAGFAGALELPAAVDKDWRDSSITDPRDAALIQKLKATRIAWLEWMIKQVEKS